MTTVLTADAPSGRVVSGEGAPPARISVSLAYAPPPGRVSLAAALAGPLGLMTVCLAAAVLAWPEVSRGGAARIIEVALDVAPAAAREWTPWAVTVAVILPALVGAYLGWRSVWRGRRDGSASRTRDLALASIILDLTVAAIAAPHVIRAATVYRPFLFSWVTF